MLSSGGTQEQRLKVKLKNMTSSFQCYFLSQDIDFSLKSLLFHSLIIKIISKAVKHQKCCLEISSRILFFEDKVISDKLFFKDILVSLTMSVSH